MYKANKESWAEMWHAPVSFHIFVFISFHLFLYLFFLTYLPSLIIPLPPLLSYTFFIQLLCPPHFNKDPLHEFVFFLFLSPFLYHSPLTSSFSSSSLSLSFSLSFSLSIPMYPSSHFILSHFMSHLFSSQSYHLYYIISSQLYLISSSLLSDESSLSSRSSSTKLSPKVCRIPIHIFIYWIFSVLNHTFVLSLSLSLSLSLFLSLSLSLSLSLFSTLSLS